MIGGRAKNRRIHEANWCGSDARQRSFRRSVCRRRRSRVRPSLPCARTILRVAAAPVQDAAMLELPLTLAGQGWHHEACAAAASARAGFGRDFRSRLFGTERICALVVSPVRARSCSPASERGGRSPQERAKRAGNQRAVSPVRACSCSPASERGGQSPQERASGHTTLENMLYTFGVRQTRGNRR